MKTPQLFSIITAISLFPLSISHAEEYIDTAHVLSTSPVVERLYAPSEECQHSAYTDVPEEDPAKFLLGALAGGAIGSQIGGGRGKDAATALGAILGSEIAAGGGELTGEELLGAIAGGVIGNQVGGGSGKTAATATGAVLGKALASGMLSRDPRVIRRECGSKVVSRNVITSYEVEYEYNGISFIGELPYRPDNTIDVIVNVEVLEDRTR